MGIEKRLEAASTFTGYPEDGPNLQPLARDALSAIWTLKGKLTAVETELAQACRQRDDAIRRAEMARSVYVAARALWEAVSLVQPGGGMASHETVYRARRALGDALNAYTAWDEAADAPDLSSKPQSVDTSARLVDDDDRSGRPGTHAPGCELAAALVSHETPIGEREADDGIGGGHGG